MFLVRAICLLSCLSCYCVTANAQDSKLKKDSSVKTTELIRSKSSQCSEIFEQDDLKYFKHLTSQYKMQLMDGIFANVRQETYYKLELEAAFNEAILSVTSSEKTELKLALKVVKEKMNINIIPISHPPQVIQVKIGPPKILLTVLRSRKNQQIIAFTIRVIQEGGDVRGSVTLEKEFKSYYKFEALAKADGIDVTADVSWQGSAYFDFTSSTAKLIVIDETLEWSGY